MNGRRFAAFSKREQEVIASALKAFYVGTTDEAEEAIADKLIAEISRELFVPRELS
jgi:hypothetical protein